MNQISVKTMMTTGCTGILLGTSRVGARVKGDPVQGRFEFNNGVGTRLLWGQWKINSGLRLRVGQRLASAELFLQWSTG